MRASVRLFALARERAGMDEVEVELPSGATVADLRSALAAAVPGLESILGASRIALNREFADEMTPIPPSAELAVIPPVSGGEG
jgi:molybdopterin converting factor subunit 1